MHMTRTAAGFCVASAFALVASAGAAQQQSPNAPARNDGTTTTADFEQTAASKAGGAGRVSLSGCVDRAPNGTYLLKNARLDPAGSPAGAASGQGSASTTAGDPAAPAGTSGSAAGSSPGSTATGTAGTSGAATAPATGSRGPAAAAAGAVAQGAPMTWMLRSTSDLAPHVGHQVQITGRAQQAPMPGGASQGATGTSGSSGAASDAGASASTGPAGTRGSEATSNSVEVESVRTVSSSCP